MVSEPHSEVATHLGEQRLRSVPVRYVRASLRRAADAELKLIRAHLNGAPDHVHHAKLLASLAELIGRIDSANRIASADTEAVLRLFNRLKAILDDRQSGFHLARRDSRLSAHRKALSA